MSNTYMWYSAIIKPSWAPPSWLFGPVWTILYAILAITFVALFYLYNKKRIPFGVIVPFIINLAFNLIYSPLQFVAHQYVLASVDILLILGTLVWMLVAARKHVRWIFWANIPYLCWVSFATVLQLTITYLNVIR